LKVLAYSLPKPCRSVQIRFFLYALAFFKLAGKALFIEFSTSFAQCKKKNRLRKIVKMLLLYSRPTPYPEGRLQAIIGILCA